MTQCEGAGPVKVRKMGLRCNTRIGGFKGKTACAHTVPEGMLRKVSAMLPGGSAGCRTRHPPNNLLIGWHLHLLGRLQVLLNDRNVRIGKGFHIGILDVFGVTLQF